MQGSHTPPHPKYGSPVPTLAHATCTCTCTRNASTHACMHAHTEGVGERERDRERDIERERVAWGHRAASNPSILHIWQNRV
jgi:hypothetical protein